MASLGLWYVRERWLQSSGRWHSVDPVPTEPAYQYVRNMPTMAVDPSGRLGPQLAACIAGAVIGGAWDVILGIREWGRCKNKCEFWCDTVPDFVTDLVGGCLSGVIASLAHGPFAMYASCMMGALLDQLADGIGEWCKSTRCHRTPAELRLNTCVALFSFFACAGGATVIGGLADDDLFRRWLRDNWKYIGPILEELMSLS